MVDELVDTRTAFSAALDYIKVLVFDEGDLLGRFCPVCGDTVSNCDQDTVYDCPGRPIRVFYFTHRPLMVNEHD